MGISKTRKKASLFYSEEYLENISIKSFNKEVLIFSILEEWYEKYITSLVINYKRNEVFKDVPAKVI